MPFWGCSQTGLIVFSNTRKLPTGVSQPGMPTATGKRRNGRPFSKTVSKRRLRSNTKVVGGGASTLAGARGDTPGACLLGAGGAGASGFGSCGFGAVAGTTGPAKGAARGTAKTAGTASWGPLIWSGSGPPSRAAAPGETNGGGAAGGDFAADVVAVAGVPGALEPASADG